MNRKRPYFANEFQREPTFRNGRVRCAREVVADYALKVVKSKQYEITESSDF